MADFLPPVWLPDERTRMLRRQVVRRRPPVSDLFGRTGRTWLAHLDLPADEQQAVGALLRQLDFHGEELGLVDGELAREALGDRSRDG